jgi:hypothetical protein
VVLAILIAVLIILINPLEQLRKTGDSNKRNMAAEYLNACTRYYANHEEMPWQDTSPLALAFNEEPVLSYTQKLIEDKELKEEFNRFLTDNSHQVYLTASLSPPEVIICFDPGSKALSADEETRYGVDGSLKAGCPNPGEACYWCLRQE